MSVAATPKHRDTHHDAHHDQTSMFTLGFWLFLVTDCLLFGTLFACYVVLRHHTDGGPTGKDLFDITGFSAETFILLTSSFTSGLAMLGMHRKSKPQIIGWMIVTMVLGALFVGLEVNEFSHLVSDGASISRSAFLSGFFTLVGTHGMHVTVGLFWMLSILIQIVRYGMDEMNERKLFLASLYWHFLDAVWIFIFTFVYMMGVM